MSALLAVLAGPANAGPVDFGPGFLVVPILAGLFYALYLIVPVLGYRLWRRGFRFAACGLAALWLVGAVIVPLVDWQGARVQTQAHWDMRVMPDDLPIAGKAFLTDDTVRTPHYALNRFNEPGALYGLYYARDSAAALTSGPVDLADFQYFQTLYEAGRYKDSRKIEIERGTRIAPDYMMLSGFSGAKPALLDTLSHPDGHRFPDGFGAEFAIVAVDDPAAFDLSAAKVVMLVPYASRSHYTPPFNPLVRRVHSAVSYSDKMSLLISYFCRDLDPEARDRCRRDI